MFELLIKASKYLFIFYILFFLWQGLAYVTMGRKIHFGHGKQAPSIQRILIIFMHITAFLILSYEPGQFLFNQSTLILAGGGLAFLLILNFSAHYVYHDSNPLIWNAMAFLLDIGLIMLQRLDPALAIRQMIWISIGFAVTLLIPVMIQLVPRFEQLELLSVILAVIFMLLPFFFGKKEYGSLNWINLGPVSFQPSEIVKFLFIFYLASVFRKKVEVKQIILTGFVSAGIVLLLVIQKDLGGALIFFMTYMVMLYIATSNSWLFLAGLGTASVCAAAAYQLFSHVRVRVMAWQDPWKDIDAGGYQIVQSLFAITTWGLMGSGLTQGMPTSIPVGSKDFIFAAICEELGSLFGVGIVCIYIMLLFCGIQVALSSKRRYYSLLAAGISCMMSFQTFLIIGGVIKLIPVTGVTMPFVSYGGSSVFVSILMVGLLQWINVYSEKNQNEEAGGDNYE